MVNDLDQALAILGLTEGATQGDVKKAYRKLSHKYHPDKQAEADKVHAAEMYKLIQSAHEFANAYVQPGPATDRAQSRPADPEPTQKTRRGRPLWLKILAGPFYLAAFIVSPFFSRVADVGRGTGSMSRRWRGHVRDELDDFSVVKRLIVDPLFFGGLLAGVRYGLDRLIPILRGMAPTGRLRAPDDLKELAWDTLRRLCGVLVVAFEALTRWLDWAAFGFAGISGPPPLRLAIAGGIIVLVIAASTLIAAWLKATVKMMLRRPAD